MSIAIIPTTMTSLELVDFINTDREDQDLSHSNFLAKVPKVLGDGCHSFECDLPDGYGRSRRGYRFQKREACLMAMSYSYDLQAKVFDRMTALESTQAAPAFAIPQTYAAALRLCADQSDQIEEQAAQLAIAAPAKAFVDRYVEAEGLKGFRQVASLIKANEARFREFLLDKKIMYRLGGKLAAYRAHIDAGRFVVKTDISKVNGHVFNESKFTLKGEMWIAGEWAKHCLVADAAEV